MQIHTHNNRRIIQHDNSHYDIEELRLVEAEDFEYVWAVIYCSEDNMSFTFSSNEATDYPALGMCDTCGKRFTQGCEHSNTIEAQEWLAAHIVAEQTISITDEDANDISNLIATAEAEIFTDGFADERIDNGLYDDQPYRPAFLAGGDTNKV